MDLLRLDRLARIRAEAAARLEYLTGMAVDTADDLERLTHTKAVAEARAEYQVAEQNYQRATSTLSDADLRALKSGAYHNSSLVLRPNSGRADHENALLPLLSPPHQGTWPV